MTSSSDRVAMIRDNLTQALHPVHLEIMDESHQHASHPGARQGGGHFTVSIVSTAFTGKRLLERHRMIYAALDHAMQRDIHALSIRAYTMDEFRILHKEV